ncbi:hypothetical protein BaRGS_00013711 [Batillaria attramentaria]|uniref:Uncharacterized protein n=1 Tax=Batillaria attramentaria TaxID=370345 RepID=A0ABD0L6B6_9CAEN|nr:hypothetical protein BaRGS_010717 [Batillaria attramentaria]
MIYPREDTPSSTTTGSTMPVLPPANSNPGMTYTSDTNVSGTLVSIVCNETMGNASKPSAVHDSVGLQEKAPQGYHLSDLDALFYIIVVLSFYAVSIVLLMITYIRREQEETSLDYYYTEYVKRTWFQQPVVQNRMAMDRDRKWLEKIVEAKPASRPHHETGENEACKTVLLETHL